MATEEQIREYLSQPGLSEAQIQSTMVDWNVSPEQLSSVRSPLSQVAQAPEQVVTTQNTQTPTQISAAQNLFNTYATGFDPGQSGYDYWAGKINELGLEGATQQFLNPYDVNAPRMAYMQADPEWQAQRATVEKLYEDVLGRTPEPEGLTYWQKTFGDVIDPNEISTFKQAAAPELVSQAYQTVLGREGDPEGIAYWTEQLRSGALTPENITENLANAAIGASTTLEDKLAVQKYFGKDIYAPEEFLTRTGGMSYQDAVNYVSENIDDPTKVYQYAQQYNVNPNDVVAAMQAKNATQLTSLSDVENFFKQGQEGFGARYDQIIDETFGNEEERQKLEKILKMEEGDLKSIYDPSQFSKSSIEKIEETLQSGRINKIQDALITKTIAKDILGYTDDEMKTVVSDLAQGKEDDPILKNIFKSLKSGNRMTQDEFESVISEAAKENPNSEIFKRNPELAARYVPIGKPKEGVSGQYGYYNNAPILNMSALDRYLKDSNQTKLDLGEGDLGWATNSKYAGEVRNGAAIFGVKATPQQIKNFDQVEQLIQKSGGVQKIVDAEGVAVEGIYTDSYDQEAGGYYKKFVPLNQLYWNVPGYDIETGGNPIQDYQDTRSQLESAAQKLNIDPRQFGTTKELFDAVQDASKDLYMVVGRAQGWDPNIAKKSGITVTDGRHGGINHAAVLYKRFGDKGIAVQAPQSFGFDDPKTKGFLQELASVPFISELALLTPAAPFYPAIKAAQVAALGGDLEDALKAGALSYLGQSAISQIAPSITASIGNSLLEAGISPEIAGTLADAGARVAINSGMSAIAGGDIAQAAERSLLAYGVGKGVSGGLSLADFPTEYQPEVARLLTEGVISGNFKDAAANAVMRFGSAQMKSAIKDVNQPIPTMQAARGGLAQASRGPRPVRSPRRVAAIRRDVRKLIPLRKSGLSYV